MDRDHLKLGVVVTSMVVVLVLFTLFIAKISFTPSREFAVLFDANASLPLLKKGSAVNYGGQQVGEVRSVTLTTAEDGEVAGLITRVTAFIDKRVQLRMDGAIRASGPLLGGTGILEIRGLGRAEQVADLDHPVRGEAGGILSQVESLGQEFDARRADSLLALVKSQLDENREGSAVALIRRNLLDLDDVINRIRHEADPESEKTLLAKLHQIVEAVNLTLARVSQQTDPTIPTTLIARIHGLVDHLDAILAETRQLARDGRPKMDLLLTEMDGAIEQLRADILTPLGEEMDRGRQTSLLNRLSSVMQRADRSLADLNEVTAVTKELVVVNQARLDGVIADMKVMSDHLAQAAKEIRRNPWRLTHVPTLEETRDLRILDAAREFSEAAGHLDDAIGRLSGLARARGSDLDADDPDLKEVRELIRTTKERYSEVEAALWRELEQK